MLAAYYSSIPVNRQQILVLFTDVLETVLVFQNFIKIMEM